MLVGGSRSFWEYGLCTQLLAFKVELFQFCWVICLGRACSLGTLFIGGGNICTYLCFTVILPAVLVGAWMPPPVRVELYVSLLCALNRRDLASGRVLE